MRDERVPCPCPACVKDREVYDAKKHILLLAWVMGFGVLYLALCLWNR